ncbi:aldose 1-epimerase [Deinococcus malanensis]|uniref:Aldose 1-epimerase n=1 Tax=Deinococcus malanensis TaxID=1706855 RepID=A0ABQ2ENM9_9DEIO|nr:aldose epimerase family protein [Deinococcus malanensis]GGK17440.1 aldose 1-epimerase [Deinococcus malanensis]
MTDKHLSGPVGSITAEPWGHSPEGREITLYTLRTPDQTEAAIMDYGGVLVRLLLPDRAGRLEDVVLGHDEAAPYFTRDQSPYFGALIGRYGNRIAQGRFTLDGETYNLGCNDGPNALHGGEGGFDHRHWLGEMRLADTGPALDLTYSSPAGEEGYPGRLDVRVTYVLGLPGQLEITYHAECDAPTIVNLTQHSYWNLVGDARRDILEHELQIEADAMTPVSAQLLPTGTLKPVEGTPFDFRTWRHLGDALREHGHEEQLQQAKGYDHNFVLRDAPGMRLAAQLREPRSGRCLMVTTTEPGLQVYTGNYLNGIRGKGGQTYDQHWGICLETQHFPDSPNQPHFPSTVLRPGETYTSQTCYAFTFYDAPEPLT